MTRYEPTWTSLDRHVTPAWFRDAKFGLFIHYSSAWYGDGALATPDQFDPESIVELAASAGMRYVVFTSKHHDGFANWPSEYGSYAAEPPFGVHDLVSPLAEAVRARGLRLGFYYSWLDEHDPGYPDPDDYVHDVAHKQLHELVELYDPDLLWGDGEWDYDAAHWDAGSVAAWFYNQADARGRSVALNDRLGRDARYYYVRDEDDDPKGDYWTPEHQVFDDVMVTPWETCETMHDGWGWDDEPNWRDPGDLIRLLVYVVSNNGNLLLNVGPKPDGSLSAHERTVLREFGDWMAVNGPAIHGTRPYRAPGDDPQMVPEVDWEHPERTWSTLCEHIEAADPVRMTRRGTTAYAIHLGEPDDAITVDDVAIRDGGTVELLGYGPVEHTHDGRDLTIEVPTGRPTDHAHAFAIPLPLRD